ncbi:hypothetical protein JTB14_022788 [Gonioctena quinquepunctata]|nr:hypothetical protein JTB14_022788 [Gonioctena quinquepunctata]
MPTEEIILEIEETPIVCKKQDLITNSDYFKAMLEGEFMEKDKETIKLQDVDLKAMNIILTLLWDETFLNVIAFEDILTVLQAACMLQFINISHLCIERITQILNPKNCLKVWLLTEQLSIKPLYLKAKSMALEEFTLIRDTECLNELTLEQFLLHWTREFEG